jgi:heme/copper-type cytochrome/quinol oxidase subunit 2
MRVAGERFEILANSSSHFGPQVKKYDWSTGESTGPCSVRVAFVTIFLVIVILFVLVVFFFFVWLFSNEDIRNCRAIRKVWVEVFWT